MTDFMSEYAKHQAARAKANALNKTVLFDALSAAGITTVHAEFDGSGDSGQINDVTAVAGDQAAEFPCVAILLHDTQWGKQELATKKVDLREAVEEEGSEHLAQEARAPAQEDAAVREGFGGGKPGLAHATSAMTMGGRWSMVTSAERPTWLRPIAIASSSEAARSQPRRSGT